MSKTSNSSATLSFGVGNVVAAVVSWTTNHSIFWAILHTLFGWLYVAYYVTLKLVR